MNTIRNTIAASALLIAFGGASATTLGDVGDAVRSAFTDCSAGVHIGTYHADRDAGYQEFNPGAFAQCRGATVGAYYNSERRVSVYGGRTFEWGYFNVTVGAITGYKTGAVLPLVIPGVKLGDSGWRLLLVPPVPGAKNDMTALHVAYTFN